MYTTGQGVKQNHRQVVFWLNKAAEQGDVDSQYNLGNMFNTGRGVKRDPQQAIYWWNKAAEQGYALAQFNLGVSYSSGQGVTKDYIRSYMWYLCSEYLGDSDASKAKSRVSKKMTSEQIQKAQQMAQEWIDNFESNRKKK